MFGRRFFGGRYFAARYFGEGGSGEPSPSSDASARRGGLSGVVGGVLSDPKSGSTEARQ
jgi:hypothetical protein